MDIKLIAIDIDGTLVKSKKELTAGVKAAINSFFEFTKVPSISIAINLISILISIPLFPFYISTIS